jgi:Tfp pilus assembly protein PilN
MIRINLAVERARPKVKRKVAVPGGVFLLYIGLAALLGAAALAAHWYFLIRPQIVELEGKIQQLQAKKTELGPYQQRLEVVKANQARLANQKKVIDDLIANRSGPVKLLEAVGTTVSLSDTVWLTSMNEKSEGNIEFIGRAGSVDAVANLITNLNNSGLFRDVEIKETEQRGGKNEPASFEFTLTAKFTGYVKPGGEAEAAPAPAGKRG